MTDTATEGNRFAFQVPVRLYGPNVITAKAADYGNGKKGDPEYSTRAFFPKDHAEVKAFSAALAKARELIGNIVAEAEIGKVYKGKVARIMEYGAFVEIMPGTDGLVHISQIHSATGRIDNINDVLKVGQGVRVKVIEADDKGRLRLSIKAIGGIEAQQTEAAPAAPAEVAPAPEAAQ